MKIGIVSSGVESLVLFKILNKYDCEYIVYFDSLMASYGDKDFWTSLSAVKKGVETLKKQWAEMIIVPPVYELALLKEGEDQILPLFRAYLFEFVFKYSLVGKLGIFGDGEELSVAQKLISDFAAQYVLQPAQSATKRFHFPFVFWSEKLGVAKGLLSQLSWKSYLTNTLLKHQLLPFKDAMIDTLIPLNYCIFASEKTVAKFLNFKKIRFHTLESLDQIFSSFLKDKNLNTYSVRILVTDSVASLFEQKRLVRLMQRGKEIVLETERG